MYAVLEPRCRQLRSEEENCPQFKVGEIIHCINKNSSYHMRKGFIIDTNFGIEDEGGVKVGFFLKEEIYTPLGDLLGLGFDTTWIRLKDDVCVNSIIEGKNAMVDFNLLGTTAKYGDYVVISGDNYYNGHFGTFTKTIKSKQREVLTGGGGAHVLLFHGEGSDIFPLSDLHPVEIKVPGTDMVSLGETYHH